MLDAVRLATMPHHQQIRAIAALARGHKARRPHVGIEEVIGMLVEPGETTSYLREVELEMRRQEGVSSSRVKLRLAIDLLQSDERPNKHQRLNRLCPGVFGPIGAWKSFDTIVDRSGRPVFNWLRRDAAGVLVAGVDQLVGDECRTGFVIKRSSTGPTMFSTLPTRAQTYNDLMIILGLPMRLLDGRDVIVDWSNRAFIVSRTRVLPWVYP